MPTQTSEQTRRSRRQDYDAFLRDCPSRKLLDRVGSKWVTLILTSLDSGPLRYSELRHEIAGVSEKMLTQTLRELERDGLVDRTMTPGVPPRVDYALTELGSSLLGPISLLKSWAEAHMPEIEAARRAFDEERH